MLFNLKLYHSVPSAGATNYYTKLSQRNYHDSAARGPIDFQTLADPYDRVWWTVKAISYVDLALWRATLRHYS